MKKILVLSGGGSFGCFEMAVVSALILEGKGSWDMFTGVSAGSFNASFLSCIEKNKEVDNINLFKKLWFDIKNSNVFQKEYFFNGLSFYTSDKYKKTVIEVYKDKIPVRPVMISATSLIKSKSVIFTSILLFSIRKSFNPILNLSFDEFFGTIKIESKFNLLCLNLLNLSFNLYNVINI